LYDCIILGRSAPPSLSLSLSLCVYTVLYQCGRTSHAYKQTDCPSACVCASVSAGLCHFTLGCASFVDGHRARRLKLIDGVGRTLWRSSSRLAQAVDRRGEHARMPRNYAAPSRRDIAMLRYLPMYTHTAPQIYRTIMARVGT